jgi:outer membrane protein assembly factor BamD (BamD/ComL family)
VVCIDIQPKIIACLGEGSRVRVSSAEGPSRRVDLVAGSVAVALDPQPRGSRFSVVAGGVWSMAVGTAFSVEIAEGGAVHTAVYEGKVRVGSETEGAVIEAHKIGLSEGGSVDVGTIEKADRSRKWTALEEVTGKRFDALAPEEPPEPATSAAAAPARVEAPQVPAEPARKVEALSAADWLARARDSRRAQQWAEAADAYRSLRAQHPASAEASAVLVSLGELELTQLGQPERALRSFESYLASGGPLAIEASLGRIRALRTLGRSAEEAAAIDSFLQQHPKSLQAADLQARLEALRTR